MRRAPARPAPDAPAAPWGFLVTLSLILHLAGFGLAVGLPRLLPRAAGPAPVYVVDLVAMPSVLPGAPPPGGATAPAPAPPAPAKPEKTIKIPEPAAKKPQPKKPEKQPEKKPEKKPATKPEPAKTETRTAETAPAEPKKTSEPTAAGSTPGASPGAAVAGSGPGTGRPGVEGGTGSGGADAYTFYYALLDRKIRGAWKKPLDPENLAARQRLACLITLSLSSSGRVTSLQLTKPSGFDPLDHSATRAVRDAEPFPPFPYQLGVNTLTINFEFVLTP